MSKQFTGRFVVFYAFHTVIDCIGAVICEDKPVGLSKQAVLQGSSAPSRKVLVFVKKLCVRDLE